MFQFKEKISNIMQNKRGLERSNCTEKSFCLFNHIEAILKSFRSVF